MHIIGETLLGGKKVHGYLHVCTRRKRKKKARSNNARFNYMLLHNVYFRVEMLFRITGKGKTLTFFSPRKRIWRKLDETVVLKYYTSYIYIYTFFFSIC